MAKVKVGECYYREKDGSLWIAESFQDADGVVTSEVRSIDQENDPVRLASVSQTWGAAGMVHLSGARVQATGGDPVRWQRVCLPALSQVELSVPAGNG